MEIILTAAEIAALDRQDRSKKDGGGFQRFMVRMQDSVDRETGRLALSDDDISTIQTYANYRGGGSWENWLKEAFERTLGPKLNGVP